MKQKYSHLTIMKAYKLGYVQGRLNELLYKSEKESKIQWKIDSLKVDSMLLYP
jgi:outer membrane protease